MNTDELNVSIAVAVAPLEAFRIFTEEIDLWWRGSNVAADEVTYIEVVFTPEQTGTRVAVRHFGWDALPADHPVRDAQQGAAFVRFQSRWWADLLTALQRFADPATPKSS